MDILSSLNPKQKEAVTVQGGPVLVIAGPGSGKCVTGKTIIFTNQGMFEIKEVPQFYSVKNPSSRCQAKTAGYCLKTGKKIIKNTSHWFRFKKSPVIKITTKSGYQISGTPEHPILIINKNGYLEYKQLKDFIGNEIIAISLNNNLWGKKKISADLAYFMGLLTGDGVLTATKWGIGLAESGKYLPKKFKQLVKSLFGHKKVSTYVKKGTNSVTHYIYSIAIRRKLENMGLKMVLSKYKTIPKSIMQASREAVIAFLQGLFDTDAGVHGVTFEYTTASKKLSRQVQSCLLNIGIRSSLKLKKVKKYPQNNYWRICVMGNSLRVFERLVGFKYQLNKIQTLKKIVQKPTNPNVEVMPYQTKRLKRIRAQILRKYCPYDAHNIILGKKEKAFPISHYFKNDRRPSAAQTMRILSFIPKRYENDDVRYLKNLAQNFFFDPISSIKKERDKTVYDFTVPITHSFVGNGFVNHNTRCLTYRIAYLVQKGVPAGNILAVTFTNKAAQEMRERVNKLLPSLSNSRRWPTIGTFHAVCLRILRQEIDKSPQAKYEKNFVIYDETDQLSLVKRTIKELQINPEQFKPGSVRENISRAKDELIDWPTYQEKAREYFPQTIARIYQAYQEALQKANALDFDDLIMLTVQLFRQKPDILEKYQEKWKYLLVDEAHDTNVSQYQLIKLLAQIHENIWLIADTDQSIYSWRGADFRNILNFEKDYPQAKVIFLEENYRSTKNILAASQQVITKNIQRREKNLWTKNPAGAPISLTELANEEEEGNFLIEEIENLISQGFNLRDLTVLYRTNAQSRAVEEAFLKANFPYKIIGAVKFYERKEIKDILSYLKLIANPNDSISAQRIINLPPRGIGKTTKDLLFRSEFRSEAPNRSKAPKPKLKEFYQLIDKFRQASQKISLTQLIHLIIKDIAYEKYIRDGQEEGERRWENISELFSVAYKYNRFKAGLGLEKFLEEVSLMTNHDEVETNKNLINLMTLHCAKGLEFPVVFIVGCEEGILPHSKSLSNADQMEEERRLCYVGFSRAKERLYLTFAQQRRLYGQTMANLPSRFIYDIPENLIEFRGFKALSDLNA